MPYMMRVMVQRYKLCNIFAFEQDDFLFLVNHMIYFKIHHEKCKYKDIKYKNLSTNLIIGEDHGK